jgi:hypothetical protein
MERRSKEGGDGGMEGGMEGEKEDECVIGCGSEL